MTISINDIHFSYGKRDVLSGLSVNLDKGINVILGPNGAGKSTLFHILCGLLEQNRGTVLFDNRSIHKNRRSVMSATGVVFQQSTLDLDLSVTQNLDYFASLQGLHSNVYQANLASVLDALQLNPHLHRKVRQLNGGHRRRVELARALLHKPQYLLFDEATVGLDIDSRDIIIRYIRDYVIKNNVTMIWTTHLLDEVSIKDNITLLHLGKVVDNGILEDLLVKHKQTDIKTLFRDCTQQKELTL